MTSSSEDIIYYWSWKSSVRKPCESPSNSRIGKASIGARAVGFRYAVLFAILAAHQHRAALPDTVRRRVSNPINPLPISHTAAGTGTAAGAVISLPRIAQA